MSRVPPLPVHVHEWVIGDHRDPPRVGRTEQYTLGFLERPADGPDPGDVGVVEGELVAEPIGSGPQRPTRGDEYWDVLLHGPGWSAHWRSPRHVEPGPVRLRGTLYWNWTDNRWLQTVVRGRVERVQVESVAVDTSEDDQARWSVVPGSRLLRDVTESPAMFEHGHHPGNADQPQVPYPNPWISETGVLVTLAPERAAFVPDAVAACGDDLWVADRDRPAVLRVRRPRDPAPEVTEFTWEPRTVHPADRRVHADPGGCWVTDATGVWRIDAERGARPVDDVPVGGFAYGHGRHHDVAAAGDDGTLAVIRPVATDDDPHDRLRRYRPTGEVLDDVVLPGIARTVIADGDGFLLQWIAASAHPVGDDVEGEWVQARGDRSLEERIGRVDAGGEVTTDPAGPDRPHERRAVLIGPDPPVHYTSSSRTLRTLRGLRPTRTTFDVNRHLPASRHGGTSAYPRADRLFVAGQLEFEYPPGPDGLTATWPFAGRLEPGVGTGYWFAELDPATLEALRVATVPRAPRHLDVGGDGTVWMQADHRTQSDRVHHLPLDHPWGTPAPTLVVADLTGKG